MTARLKLTIPGSIPGFACRIYWNAEFREWTARLVQRGKLDHADAAAFDNDRESIIGTGTDMLRRAEALVRFYEAIDSRIAAGERAATLLTAQQLTLIALINLELIRRTTAAERFAAQVR